VIVLGVMPTPVLDSMLHPVQSLRTPATTVQPRPLAATTDKAVAAVPATR